MGASRAKQWIQPCRWMANETPFQEERGGGWGVGALFSPVP